MDSIITSDELVANAGTEIMVNGAATSTGNGDGVRSLRSSHISQDEMETVITSDDDELVANGTEDIVISEATTSTGNDLRTRSRSHNEMGSITSDEQLVGNGRDNTGAIITSHGARSRSRCMDMVVYRAAMAGSIEVIQKCLRQQHMKQGRRRTSDDHDMNSSTLEPILLPLTPAGNSVLHLHVALPYELRRASIDFIEYVVGHDQSLVWHRNDDGDTPLHLAASFGQIDAVKRLLQHGRGGPLDMLLMTNMEGDTALHLAVRNTQLQVVRHLLSLDIEIDRSDDVVYEMYQFDMNPMFNPPTEYPANSAGETPLSLAVESGHTDLLDMVLSRTPRPQHGTAVLVAIMRRNPGMLRKILQRFPQLIKVEDDKGQTPLHYAAAECNIDVLRILLFEFNPCAAAYTQDKEAGRTAAHIAALHNNVPALKLLMDRFPSCYELVDHQERNVVHYAAFLGLPQALGYLLHDVRFSHLVNKRDKDGNTPLHLLASCLTDIPSRSVASVRRLIITKLKGLRRRVFNNEGLTAGDIAHSHDTAELEPPYQALIKHFLKVAPRGGRTKPLLLNLDDQKSLIESNIRSNKGLCTENYRKTARDHAVVAALIATVSFTAGLAVPGGFDQTTGGKYGGTAILAKQKAFQVFLISDSVALASSFLAILLYFLIALEQMKAAAGGLLYLGFFANFISMGAFMVAFMAGTYSIVWHFTSLSLSVILIVSIFMSMYVVIFIALIYSTWKSITRLCKRRYKSKRKARWGQV